MPTALVAHRCFRQTPLAELPVQSYLGVALLVDNVCQLDKHLIALDLELPPRPYWS